MKKLSLSLLLSLSLAATTFVACEKDSDNDSTIAANPIQLTSANVVATSGITIPPSPGSGTVTAVYDRDNRLLSYTINWSNLSDSVVAIHLHGLADPGFLALPAPLGPFAIDSARGQNSGPWIRFAGGIAQRIFNIVGTSTTTVRARAATGSLSGNLAVDGTVIKEEDILGGRYYFDIHTAPKATNPLYAGFGELRGQLTFPQQ